MTQNYTVNNRQYSLGSHEERPLLFSFVHLILCSRGRGASTGIPPITAACSSRRAPENMPMEPIPSGRLIGGIGPPHPTTLSRLSNERKHSQLFFCDHCLHRDTFRLLAFLFSTNQGHAVRLWPDC